MGTRGCILGWTSREREEQQKGGKIMNERRKHPLSPAWGCECTRYPSGELPWLPQHLTRVRDSRAGTPLLQASVPW